MTHFKRLSPEHFGGKQNLQSGEEHEKVKKFVFQDGDVDLEEGQEEEENSKLGEVDFHNGDIKEIINKGNRHVNCALENEIRELSEMHSIADFVRGWVG